MDGDQSTGSIIHRVTFTFTATADSIRSCCPRSLTGETVYIQLIYIHLQVQYFEFDNPENSSSEQIFPSHVIDQRCPLCVTANSSAMAACSSFNILLGEIGKTVCSLLVLVLSTQIILGS